MRPIFIIILPTFCAIQAMAYFSQTDLDGLASRIGQSSLDDLELRRADIAQQLANLARISMNSGVGRIGYRSLPHESPESTEWIEIDLGKPTRLDSIALVPAIWRDAEEGFVADGFPEAFDVEVGLPGSTTGQVISRYQAAAGILPRVAPFVIDCHGVNASWVRITARRLSTRRFDGLYVFQLSEVFIFSGDDNIALSQPVRCSSTSIAGSGAWSEQFLVDGMTPYLMDSATGRGSVAFANDVEIVEQPSILIDLEAPYVTDRLALHVIEQTDTVPQAFPGDYGVPYAFILEGSLTGDFADPILLASYHRDDIYAIGPTISCLLNPGLCRYVRLTATKPYIYNGIGESTVIFRERRLGFAEIEIFSQSRNVALGKPVTCNFDHGTGIRKIEALTDGKNLYGRIVGVRDWILQLAERHDLEVELPMVNHELEYRYERQKVNLYRLKLSIGTILLLVTILFLVARTRQQRAIYRTRERITADLHDVLGGNISAIGLLSQFAGTQMNDPEQVGGCLRRIDTLASRTRNALKYISDMLNQPGLYQNLLAEMNRIAKGLTEGLEHDFQYSGESYIAQIDQRQRIDIFLFYKECLVNIIRHARATRIETRLSINAQDLELVVCDNGIGLPGSGPPAVPVSLKRRARILGAAVAVSRTEKGGTCVRLVLRWNQPWPMRLFHRLSRQLAELKPHSS